MLSSVPAPLISRTAFTVAGGMLLVAIILARWVGRLYSRASEGRWRAVFDNSAVGITVIDRTGRFTAANLAFQIMVGYSEQELRGMSCLDLTHADDRAAQAQMYAQLEQGCNTQLRIATRYWRKDGRLIWVRNTISKGPAAGRMPAFCMSIEEDITEARQAEERLRQYEKVVESSGEMMVMVDRQYRHLIVNQAFLDFRGLRREQVIGHSVEEFGESLFACLKPMMDECFEGREVKAEIKCPNSVHGERDLLISYFPIESPSGVDLAVGIVRDITEQKCAADEVERSFGQLRALTNQLQSVREEERRRLARELHDELGQSLTAFRIELTSLKTIADRQQQLQRIDSLLHLVDATIHSVRRISTELRPGILDDLGLVAAVEWAAEEFQSRTGIRCLVNLPEADPAIDPDRATALFRIVQETLTNVARHSGATEVRITLAQKEGHLPLEISDNGRGTTPEQLSATTSLGILGMGERARLLGGEFSIRSHPGKGTTVRVSLPSRDTLSAEAHA